jgi:Uma2 family endonuclease
MIDVTTHIPISFQSRRKLKTYTLTEYLRKEAKSTDKHEFINGNIIKMPYAKGPHNIIASNMTVALGIAFEQANKNCILFNSDQKIYFPSLNEGVYADTLAVSERPIYWDDEKLLLINPMIIVEVLSKSTQKYDRSGKFDKYKTLESIRDYVLIRQDECYAEVWHREAPGYWRETIISDISSQLPLQSVDIELSMQRIYKNVEL